MSLSASLFYESRYTLFCVIRANKHSNKIAFQLKADHRDTRHTDTLLCSGPRSATSVPRL